MHCPLRLRNQKVAFQKEFCFFIHAKEENQAARSDKSAVAYPGNHRVG